MVIFQVLLWQTTGKFLKNVTISSTTIDVLHDRAVLRTGFLLIKVHLKMLRYGYDKSCNFTSTKNVNMLGTFMHRIMFIIFSLH